MEVNNGSRGPSLPSPAPSITLQPQPAAFDPSVPLRGVVLCCTSIPPDTRTALAKQAEQMGAQHKYDLTSEVTHLIVGEYDTPKYRYVAKERPDVKILTVGWIEAIRQLWISDKHIDLEALEAEHTLPTLASLIVCMTGFEDSAERTNIINLICSNRGEYHGDLTRSITHLIASRPEGKKYKFAKDWKIRLVSAEWLYDSIQRGMILDENLYHPETPAEERGKGAWVRRNAASPLGKRLRENEAVEDGTRKLRRTLSRKLTSQNEVVWGDIVGGGSTLLTKNADSEQPPRGIPGDGQTSQRASSDELNLTAGMAQTSAPISMKRAAFSQCRFCIHGYEPRKAKTLSRHLLSHDGDVRDIDDLPVATPPFKNYMVVPHDFAVVGLPPIPEGTPVVTEWWVERCLEANECLEHSASYFDLPFASNSIDGFKKLVISTTGFTGFHLLHLSKAAAIMGATYDEYFSEKTSVLICNATQQIRVEKLQRAKEWRIPVVSIDWLLESIRTCSKQPYKPYLLRSKANKSGMSEIRSASEVMLRKEIEHDEFESHQDLPFSKSTTSEGISRPGTVISRDTTAFENDDDDDEPTEAVGGFLIPNKATEQLTEQPTKPIPPTQPPLDHNTESPAEPLTEISSNSPRKSPVSQPKPSATTSNTDSQEISSAITSLLAKSKNLPNSGPSVSGGTESAAQQRPARKPSRILGRAPSNISVVSRASSVDSTASGGQAVHWPAGKRPLAKVDSLGSLAGVVGGRGGGEGGRAADDAAVAV
ncbi:hypothetical protein GMDG_08472 [Pseudogymnoascus destructans 20631-21]|uniref:BRCT domain-containing protein n=1 Tax=Pseudogymnoascus destructans (strain ATCC MYA-4855 / 20631-21) TaxID=658429 RepID=L8G347_PSED2|nr:hypothetical protein GMDG_08472 [Pseudogymnoascus destructans 20631-21]